MTQQTATRTATFSATTSWVGVVLLGAGLTQEGLPPSQATSPGPQTASVEYQGFDEYFGVLSGGVQRDFTSGQYGWQGPAFDALGMMGMEWTTATGTLSRASSSSATLSVMAAPPPPVVEEPLATPDPPSSSTPAAPTSDSPPAEVTIAPVPSEPALVRTPVGQSFDIPVVLLPVTESTPQNPRAALQRKSAPERGRSGVPDS